MKPGTPGFIGARLKEGREARGISAVTLAELVDVSRQAISQYENDLQTPRPEIMDKICQVLNLPPHFFWRSMDKEEVFHKIFYRSMRSSTKMARERAECKYNWLRDIADYLRKFIEFPQVNFPDFKLSSNPHMISSNDIEEIALATRRHWKLGDGPISNIVLLLENNGVIVTRGELVADTLDAFSEWYELCSQNTPYVFLGKDKDSAVRSRYDASHELGHLILHRSIDKSYLTRPAEFNLIEEQAHRFAGAFLLPSSTFAKEFSVPTLDTFRALKSKWRVSIATMISRSQELGLISSEGARRLWINLTRRGWRTREPLDDTLPTENPQLLSRGFQLLVDNKIQTRDEIMVALPYSLRDIEELACLTTNFLDETPPTVNVVGLNTFRNNSVQTDLNLSSKNPADILSFKSKTTKW